MRRFHLLGLVPTASAFSLVAFLLGIAVGCHARAQQASPSVVGKWYGFTEGSPMTVEFREDQTVTFKVDANANASFTCRYQVDDKVKPVAVDLRGIHPESLNMDCAAIVSFRGDDEMEFFGAFGPQGQAQRPRAIDRNSPSLSVLYAKLSRDPKTIQQDDKVMPAPPEASLAFERNKRLGRGLNLSDVLDGREVRPINPESFKTIRAAGFENLRIPIRWSAHCTKKPPYTIDPAFFREVDQVVRLSLDNGLAVAVDVHYYPVFSFQEDRDIESRDENLNRFYSLWEQIAEHYKGYPPEVYFSILNEPSKELGAAGLNQLVVRTLKIIRRTNPDRTVLVDTPNQGQSWSLGLLELPRDDWNLITEVHYYMPHNFTHQGADFVPGAMAWRGTKWTGTREEREAIEKDLGFCAAWGRRNHRPIHLGEFGAINEADGPSRARWIAFVRRTAEKDGMSFAVWSFSRSVFAVFDETTGRWDQPLRDALVPPK